MYFLARSSASSANKNPNPSTKCYFRCIYVLWMTRLPCTFAVGRCWFLQQIGASADGTAALQIIWSFAVLCTHPTEAGAARWSTGQCSIAHKIQLGYWHAFLDTWVKWVPHQILPSGTSCDMFVSITDTLLSFFFFNSSSWISVA